jgi:hypothetical protein
MLYVQDSAKWWIFEKYKVHSARMFHIDSNTALKICILNRICMYITKNKHDGNIMMTEVRGCECI